MVGGHTGKILRINLSNKAIDSIPTSKYEQWIGGHGMGSAIFWDLFADKTLTDGYDPRNIITIIGRENGWRTYREDPENRSK